ncbi:MAG: twin-arginine translocation signal domain-containing protein [Actinomycetota bacterium]|nr:twin-arginine translocation signal domain-containing protein [Actinomycetota bacterium]
MGTISRREFLARSSLGAGAAALGTAALGTSELLRPATASAAPRSHALWGAFVAPKGNTRTSSVKAFEDLIGRHIDVTRHYLNFDRRLVNSVVQESVDSGHIPLVGMIAKRSNGTSAKWSDIANGKYDLELEDKGKTLRDLAVPVYFVFNPEPENDVRAGGAPQFRAAFNHIRMVFDSVGASNLRWMATLMRGTYHGAQGGPKRWMPSAADIVGADGYNRGGCSDGGWVSFRDIFTAARNYARSHGMPLFVEEWGAVEGTSCGQHLGHDKATWIRAAGESIRSWPELEGVCYSQTRAYYARTGKTVDYRVNTSQRSLDAYRRVGLTLPSAQSTLCHIQPDDQQTCDPVALH